MEGIGMANAAVGPASKGSRYCLQCYVELNPDGFADQIVSASPALTAFDPVRVDWKSPLAREEYQEYRDDFFRYLGLEQHQAALRDYWPLQGPQWDGLALLPSATATGVLLIEAKAHPGETESSCEARSPTSRETIRRALARVQDYMGTTPGVTPDHWMSGTYQLANRLAFLYFLNEIARVPAFLALVNFVDDRSYRPTSLAEWRNYQQGLFRHLGIHHKCKMLSRIIVLFPTALE